MQMQDVLKELTIWTLGACVNWNHEAKQFNPGTQHSQFMDFYDRTLAMVIRHVVNAETLGPQFSDTEAALAMRAQKLFGHHFIKCNSCDRCNGACIQVV